jgi:hypothetical protein
MNSLTKTAAPKSPALFTGKTVPNTSPAHMH